MEGWLYLAYVNQDVLRRDINKYVTTVAETYCKLGRKNITKAAHYAMKSFYKDYKPKYYNRTYDLYDPKKENQLENGSIVPYYHNNGNQIYGGVRITTKNMSPYQIWSSNPTPARDVAYFAWHGYHGHPLRDIVMYKSPLDIVKRIMADNRLKKAIMVEAAKAVKKQKYELLRL